VVKCETAVIGLSSVVGELIMLELALEMVL